MLFVNIRDCDERTMHAKLSLLLYYLLDLGHLQPEQARETFGTCNSHHMKYSIATTITTIYNVLMSPLPLSSRGFPLHLLSASPVRRMLGSLVPPRLGRAAAVGGYAPGLFCCRQGISGIGGCWGRVGQQPSTRSGLQAAEQECPSRSTIQGMSE